MEKPKPNKDLWLKRAEFIKENFEGFEDMEIPHLAIICRSLCVKFGISNVYDEKDIVPKFNIFKECPEGLSPNKTLNEKTRGRMSTTKKTKEKIKTGYYAMYKGLMMEDVFKEMMQDVNLSLDGSFVDNINGTGVPREKSMIPKNIEVVILESSKIKGKSKILYYDFYKPLLDKIKEITGLKDVDMSIHRGYTHTSLLISFNIPSKGKNTAKYSYSEDYIQFEYLSNSKNIDCLKLSDIHREVFKEFNKFVRWRNDRF